MNKQKINKHSTVYQCFLLLFLILISLNVQKKKINGFFDQKKDFFIVTKENQFATLALIVVAIAEMVELFQGAF